MSNGQENNVSEHSGTARRLESLSGRTVGRGGSRPRFIPKNVTRRSKEDRDNSAPLVKVESTSPGFAEKSKSLYRARQRQPNVVQAEAEGPFSKPFVEKAPSYHKAGPTKSKETTRLNKPAVSIKVEQNEHSVYDKKHRIDAAAPLNGDPFFPVPILQNASNQQPVESRIPPNFESGNLYLLQLPLLGLEGKEGRIGTLRRYSSGRLTLDIGGSILDVSPGVRSQSLETAVLAHSAGAVELGRICGRLMAVPDLSCIQRDSDRQLQ